MNWKEILIKAWEYIKRYRALWYLGVLAALTEGGSSGANFYNFNSSGGGSSNSASNSLQSTMNSGINWISGNRMEFGIIVFAGFLVSLIILYISYSARAGLISSIYKVESGDKKPEFHQAFHSGQKYFWRFLGLNILMAVLVFAVAFVLIGLLVTLLILVLAVSLWFLILLLPLGLLLILGLIILAVYLNLVLILAYREIVIKNKAVLASIADAREIIHHHFTNVLLAWLIQAAIGVVAGIILVVVMMVVGGALLALGAGIYFAGGLTAVIIYGVVAALLFIALVLLLGGIVNAYYSAYWTIVYKKLND